MAKMALHKKFIDELGKRRMAKVGEIITSLNILSIKDNRIFDLNGNLDQLEQIFYTADYLLENKLVIEKQKQIIGSVPDFSPLSFINEADKESFRASRIFAFAEYLKEYWGRNYLVRPIYFKMINNGYKTDQEKKEFWQFWLPIISAIVAAFLTGLFTKIFANSNCCFIWLIK